MYILISLLKSFHHFLFNFIVIKFLLILSRKSPFWHACHVWHVKSSLWYLLVGYTFPELNPRTSIACLSEQKSSKWNQVIQLLLLLLLFVFFYSCTFSSLIVLHISILKKAKIKQQFNGHDNQNGYDNGYDLLKGFVYSLIIWDQSRLEKSVCDYNVLNSFLRYC